MILYHGSNVEIDVPDLKKCKPYKDFGCGFYTTSIREQAWRMALRTTRIGGGVPTVTVYEVPDDVLDMPELHCRNFGEKPSVEWAVFINNNRNRAFGDVASPDCNADHKYDVVVGPVADDTVSLLLRQFERGIIDVEALKRGFDFGEVTDQYTFHTEKALKYLKKAGVLHDG